MKYCSHIIHVSIACAVEVDEVAPTNLQLLNPVLDVCSMGVEL